MLVTVPNVSTITTPISWMDNVCAGHLSTKSLTQMESVTTATWPVVVLVFLGNRKHASNVLTLLLPLLTALAHAPMTTSSMRMDSAMNAKSLAAIVVPQPPIKFV